MDIKSAFFELVRAGLWEIDAHLLQYGEIDFNHLLRLAEEQSIVGIVAAGIDHVVDIKVPRELALLFVGQTLQIERRNSEMNVFIGQLIEKMRVADIYALLVKGQGIAQCYERPMWRSSGDVDLLLSEDNFKKTRAFLTPLASSLETEGGPHLGLKIDKWIVELHGDLSCGLSSQMDRVIDELKYDVFYGGNVRTWLNGGIQIFLPGIDDDVIIIFTHLIKHFYKGGIGLRQICDWSRLLWTYNGSLNLSLLETRIRKMGLMSEWKSFAAFSVDYLAMPSEAMPFYSSSKKWSNKAKRISRFVICVGNMGHNRDNDYYRNYSFIVRKGISLNRRLVDFCNHLLIFPVDSIKFIFRILLNGVHLAAKGIG